MFRRLFFSAVLLAFPLSAQTDDSYLPLAVGNSWVYRLSSRTITNSYFTETVVRTEQIEGEAWFVIQTLPVISEQLWRWDDAGRLFRRNDAKSKPQLVLDPAAGSESPAQFPIVNRGIAAKTPFGQFTDTVDYRTIPLFDQISGRYAKGIGKVTETAILIAGSSGGISFIRDLQEATIGNRHFQTPQPSLVVSVESAKFDISNKKATNCKVPCYFVACGFAGADPSDAYKPCFQARTAFTLPDGVMNVQAWLDLYNDQGRLVMNMKSPVPPNTSGELVLYWRIPLYTGNGILLPTGNYAVLAHLLSAGDDFASAWTRVIVE